MASVAPKLHVELGGEMRELVIDLNAMAEMEDIGVNLKDISGEVGPKAIRALLWAGQLHLGKDAPSLEEVGSWIHLGNMEEVGNQLGKMMAQIGAEPEPEQEGKAEAPA